MMRMARLAWFLVLAAVGSSVAVSDLDVPTTIPDEPFDLRAAKLEYTNETVVASGGVTGTFENIVIRADQISANPETGDLHIEGNIHFERGNVLWQGDELDYNFLRQDGVFGPSSLYFDPVLMSVEHVERVTTNEYKLQGATFTTCPKAHPHIRAKAKEAKLVDETYVTAKGVTFYLGKVPILYLPYWRHKLSEGILSYKFGYSSDWGGYLHTRATLPVTEEIDYVADVNYYSDRGVGFGQGVDWDFLKAEGGFTSFYLNDDNPYEKFGQNDTNSVGPLIADERYRFKLEHIQHFSDTHYLNTEWNYLSDPAVLQEFFRSEYRGNAQPENFASWVNGKSYGGTEAFVSSRLNDFYDNVDRAEYSADLYQSQIADTPFYFQSENTASHLSRVFSETNTVDSSYSSVRLDSDNTLYWPQQYGFLNLVPRASCRATYYSHSSTNNSSNDEVRAIPGAGMEVSFQATRVLSDAHRWYGQGLRHKIEPYADYIYEESSVDAGKLRQFDYVDMLDDANKVKVGLRNVLQTKRAGRTTRFIDLDLYSHYLVERNGAAEDFENLFFDARMPLTKKLMVDVTGMYKWYDGEIEAVDTRVSYDQNNVIFSMEHLYLEDNLSLWTPRLDLYPDSKMSLETYARYDDRANDMEEIAVIGYMDWCCMRYGLGYQFYDNREHRVMLSVGLSAFPDARISSGL